MNSSNTNPGVVQITTVPQTLYRLFPNLVYRLKDLGYDVWAICSEGTWLPREKAAEKLGIDIESAPMSRLVSPGSDLQAILRIRILLRRRHPAIAHCHTPKAGLIGGIAARLAGVPTVFYTVRGLPHLTASGWLRWVLIWSETLACRLAHHVMVVSESVRQELLQRKICPAEKMSVPGAGSAQGVDAEFRFNPSRVLNLPRLRTEKNIPAQAVVLGFVGRMVKDKGFAELWSAWKILRERHPNLYLLMAGASKEPRAGVPESDLQACREDSRVIMTSVVEDIERVYAAMDIFAFPSHREGFSNAVLEAAAMGLPVSGFDVIGVRDGVRHGETGLLSTLFDVEHFTESLDKLIRNVPERTRMGTNARAWVLHNFRPADRLRFVEEAYQKALSLRSNLTSGGPTQ
jgi:glycosyltransferase involved in cell wall biosynthesis